MAEEEESRDEMRGWQEERESDEENESGMEYEDREEAQQANDGENVEEDKPEGELREDEDARSKTLVEEMHNKGSRDEHGYRKQRCQEKREQCEKGITE
jgi:hypothetical protein